MVVIVVIACALASAAQAGEPDFLAQFVAEPDPLARFAGEPKVGAVQRAAAHQAEVEPERVRSWLKRVNKAALLPGLKVRVGRGLTGVQLTHGLDGIDRYAVTATDAWKFEVEADWSLDRLLFDRNEIGLGRESQRLAARREALLTEVARLYYARRRLQVEALADAPGASDGPALERRLAIDELTAVLDGLSGGAMSKGGP
jgi:hypothetical protein